MEDTRADKGLAFMLQYENVAWYDAGAVKILDRRVYPGRVEFVTCRTHVEVMQATRDMVTQSAGPYTGCRHGHGACRVGVPGKAGKRAACVSSAGGSMHCDARPTTKKRMEQVCAGASQRQSRR